MKKYFFYALVAFSMVACGDDDADPVLTVTESTISVVAGADFSVSGVATDDLGISTVAIDSDGLGLSASANGSDLSETGAFGWTVTSDAATPEGAYEIIVTATDTGNNTATEIVTVNVTN